MITRRQIIESQRELVASELKQQSDADSNQFATRTAKQSNYRQQIMEQDANETGSRFAKPASSVGGQTGKASSSYHKPANEQADFFRHEQQYSAAPSRALRYNSGATARQQKLNDYASEQDYQAGGAEMLARARHQAASIEPAYRQFDPYSVYGDEEEDVWYSEERLFEDHLDEIFNKWRLLDDDIWCKLIIMERNRRIGKAYARVPIVTIDGSHELSYDGYKLALNGFENPDRDARTEECRKRIGKGIRIKMDNFGNILIKRLSKSAIYVKEWLHTSGQATASSSSNAGRLMPSRQQLIKNQNAMLAAMNGKPKPRQTLASQIASSISTNSITPSGSSSSGGSSLELPNDSAICDEVLSVGGCLDQDKIYVMFDMKKFQANITQELCRPSPDKRKLEQQCFSIVGLAKDADEILDLPCWVMVINIVAIEMLNERFPPISNTAGYPDALAYDRPTTTDNQLGQRAPNFVSIFERNNAQAKNNPPRDDAMTKEEDPYSLPANASSSDVKSSLNDYGTTAEARKMLAMEQSSRHYSSKRADLHLSRQPDFLSSRYRSKSNCQMHPGHPANRPQGARYNHSSSIYSPGHMLIPPQMAGVDPVPPKLPPRRDLGARRVKSKSSSSIYEQEAKFASQPSGTLPADDAIYSTGLVTDCSATAAALESTKVRKPKRNRFLESLKAPLELAKSSSNKSSANLAAVAAPESMDDNLEPNGKVGKSKSPFTKSSSRNLRSLLGVKGKTKEQNVGEDTSNYLVGSQRKSSSVQAVDKLSILEQTGDANKESASASNDSADIDSAVDSNEDVEPEQQQATGKLSNTSSTNSFNDLDIPTPDYETDENIYALEESNYSADPISAGKIGATNNKGAGRNCGPFGAKTSSLANAKTSSRGPSRGSKYDLYYSGYRAHVPAKSTGTRLVESRRGIKAASLLEEQMCTSQLAQSSRGQLSSHSRAPSLAKMNQVARESIYGSPNMAGSRYRSASMQRYLPKSSETQMRLAASDVYQELELENPYAIGGRTAIAGSVHESHYAFSALPGSNNHRRRSNSRSQSSQIYGLNPLVNSSLLRQPAGMASSNYDIGRSSSGIYGNNSSSSSSDYADWQPQMRKVNSSGYLNSIFKNHRGSPSEMFNAHPQAQKQQKQQLSNKPAKLATNNHNGNKGSQLAALQAVYNNNNNNSGSKTSSNNKTSSNGNINNNLDQQTLLHKSQTASRDFRSSRQNQSVVKQSQAASGPTFRSYDSSNDSEPSYTNSSDGLDIYDHIGGGRNLLQSRHQKFLDVPGPPEAHVGEWENMYNR